MLSNPLATRTAYKYHPPWVHYTNNLPGSHPLWWKIHSHDQTLPKQRRQLLQPSKHSITSHGTEYQCQGTHGVVPSSDDDTLTGQVWQGTGLPIQKLKVKLNIVILLTLCLPPAHSHLRVSQFFPQLSLVWNFIVTDAGRTESSMEAAHCLKRPF